MPRAGKEQDVPEVEPLVLRQRQQQDMELRARSCEPVQSSGRFQPPARMGALPAVPREQSADAKRSHSVDTRRGRGDIPREANFDELLNQFRDVEERVVKKKEKTGGRAKCPIRTLFHDLSRTKDSPLL